MINDYSVLYDHREAPPIQNWDDDAELRSALEYVYGEFSSVIDLDGLLAEIRDPETDQGEAQRYFLNQRADYADAAFDIALWDDLADPDVQVEPGGMIVAGFDGARFDDSTALTARCLETGQRWLVGLWEKPADAGRDWEVDEADVTRTVADMFEAHEVWRVYCDPPYWETPIGAWQAEHGEDRVIPWHTNRSKQMAYACKRFQTALRAGEGSHDGNPDLRRHLANAYREDLPRLKDDRGRPMWRIRKERAGSPRKIDAAMALILADEAYGDAVVAGMLNRPSYAPVKLR